MSLAGSLKRIGGFTETELDVIKKGLTFVLDGGHALESGLTVKELKIAKVILLILK